MSIHGLHAFKRSQATYHHEEPRAQPGPSVPGSLINERPGKSMWHRCHMDLQTGDQSGRPAALVAPSGRATNLAGLPGWVPPACAEAGVHSSLRVSARECSCMSIHGLRLSSWSELQLQHTQGAPNLAGLPGWSPCPKGRPKRQACRFGRPSANPCGTGATWICRVAH